jgi:hypothetical protein
MSEFSLTGTNEFLYPRLTCTIPYNLDQSEMLAHSIRKFEFLVAEQPNQSNVISTGGPSTCALCKTYRISREVPNKHWPNGMLLQCENCPVYKHTCKSGCAETPYEIYELAGFDELTIVGTAIIFQKELDYLTALLNNNIEKADQIQLWVLYWRDRGLDNFEEEGKDDEPWKE